MSNYTEVSTPSGPPPATVAPPTSDIAHGISHSLLSSSNMEVGGGVMLPVPPSVLTLCLQAYRLVGIVSHIGRGTAGGEYNIYSLQAFRVGQNADLTL